MYRAVLTVAAAAALVVGGVTPAVAASTSGVPGPATSVQVSGAGDAATLTWDAPRTGGAASGWRVDVTSWPGRSAPQADRLPAQARSDRFGSIRPGTTYTFTVRATGARGSGPEVRVRYTAPRTTTVAQSLFALDASGALVRYPTTGTGTPTTVTTAGAGYTADDVGDVFTPSADGTSILFHPAGGGAPRTLATGLHVSPDLRSDVEGNLYWVDSVSGAVTKLAVKGAVTTLLPSAGTDWAVGRDGTVSAWTAANAAGTVTTASPRGVVTTRTVGTDGSAIGYPEGFLADGRGTLYLGFRAFGGSGYHTWWSLAAGSSTLVRVTTKTAYQYSAVDQDSLVLGQSGAWCPVLGEQSPVNPCRADHTVTQLLTRDASGTVRTSPTTGLQVPSNGLWLGVADSAGDLFVDAPSGGTPGLWRVPGAGGAAQRLSDAQHSRLLVI